MPGQVRRVLGCWGVGVKIMGSVGRLVMDIGVFRRLPCGTALGRGAFVWILDGFSK